MRVAVFEEDPGELRCTLELLNRHCGTVDGGLDCLPFTSEESLRRALRRETFDLLVLDSAASGAIGGDLLFWLRELRRDAVPILLLGAADNEHDIAKALDQGADDYLRKPFRGVEFGARARRLLARTTRSLAPEGTERFGDWLFDHRRLAVKFEGRAAAPEAQTLTDREFHLALGLFRHAGKSVSRAHLLESAGWTQTCSTRLLDNHIWRLRSKLQLDLEHGVQLQAVYSKGYRLSLVPEQAEGRTDRRDLGRTSTPAPPGASFASTGY